MGGTKNCLNSGDKNKNATTKLGWRRGEWQRAKEEYKETAVEESQESSSRK